MAHTAIYETQQVLIQVCFFTPLLFLVTYTLVCPWWRTVFGRVIATLAFVFVTVLFRALLFAWHVLPPSEATRGDFLAWFSVACLALAPAAFLTLTWQLLRGPVRRWWDWLHGNGHGAPPSNPMTPPGASGDATLGDYTEQLQARHRTAGRLRAHNRPVRESRRAQET